MRWLCAPLLATAACSQPSGELIVISRAALAHTRPLEYPFRAERDAYFRIEVDQSLLDVFLEIRDAAGAVIVQTDAPGRRALPERATLHLRAGDYVAIIRSAELAGEPKHVATRIERIDSMRANGRMKAEMLETAAAEAVHVGAEDSGVQGLAYYEKAARAWRVRAQPLRAAQNRYLMGWVCYRLLGDSSAAVSHADAASRAFLQRGAERAAALSLVLASAARSDALSGFRESDADAETTRALRDIDKAERLLRKAGDAYHAAEARQVRGLIEHFRGDYAAARASFSRAEAEFAQLGERADATRAAANMAQMDSSLGRYREAAAAYARIFADGAVRRAPAMYADMLDNSGHAQAVIGDFSGAIRHYLEALKLHRELHDIAGETRSLHGIGASYLRLGHPARALEYLTRALELRREMKDGASAFAVLMAMADTHRLADETALAVEARTQAVAYAVNDIERAKARIAMAEDYIAEGKAAEATTLLRPIAEAEGTPNSAHAKALAQVALGHAYVVQGEEAAALALLRAAGATFQAQGVVDKSLEALRWTAQAHRARGELASAAEAVSDALALAERTRASASNPDVRARFLATRRAIYDLQVDLLLDESLATTDASARVRFLAAALAASEQARARALVDLRSVQAPPSTDEGSMALRSLAEDIASREYRLNAIVSTNADPKIAALLRTEILELRAHFDDMRAAPAFTLSSDDAAAPPTADQLPPNTAVLVYMLAPERSWLWSVTADALNGYELAADAVIAGAAGEVHSTLARQSAAPSEAEQALERLSALVLPDGLDALTKNQWIIVADGALHSTPFAALYPVRGERMHALEKFTLSTATTYRAALRIADRPPTLRIARKRPPVLFGDPVFSAADARLASAGAVLPPEAQTPLSRLPGGARELSAIREYMREFEPSVLVGFEATREAALSLGARESSLLHFATHAQLDASRPLAMALELSRYDRSGRALNGSVTIADLASVTMSADLVVVTSCDSGAGENVQGEGPLSLAYAFLASGANGVLASQWQVADAAMVLLMERFYASAVREGRPLSEALRSAQLDLLRTRQWRAPRYWASLTLTFAD